MTEEYKLDDENGMPRSDQRTSTGAGGLPVPSTGGTTAPTAGATTVPPTSRTFARLPGDIANHAYLDYTLKNDLQLFKDNSIQLPTKFKGPVVNLKVFTKEIGDRVDKVGWKMLIAIPVDGKVLDLLTHYTQITAKRMIEYTKTWAVI